MGTEHQCILKKNTQTEGCTSNNTGVERRGSVGNDKKE